MARQIQIASVKRGKQNPHQVYVLSKTGKVYAFKRSLNIKQQRTMFGKMKERGTITLNQWTKVKEI